MNRGDLRVQLFALLREHVNGEVQLSAATTVCGELGLSSVELMELTAQIEDRFGVRLPDQLLPELLTVGDMLRAVELRLEARGALVG